MAKNLTKMGHSPTKNEEGNRISDATLEVEKSKIFEFFKSSQNIIKCIDMV